MLVFIDFDMCCDVSDFFGSVGDLFGDCLEVCFGCLVVLC